MPRLPRVHLHDAAYYVTLDGPQNEVIFKDAADFRKYGELLAKYKQEFGFKLFAYAIFSNRLELLMEPNKEHPVSQIMQKITPSYTKYYNSRYQRKGPLFQKRFRSVILEEETHLLPLTRFVHLAPARFRQDEALNQVPFTSLGAYVNESPAALKVMGIDISQEVTGVQAKLSGIENVKSYREYMNLMDKEECAILEKKLSRTTILGSDSFVAEVRNRIKNGMHKEISHTEAALETQGAEMAVSSSRLLPVLGIVSGFALFVLATGFVLLPHYLSLNNKETASSEAPKAPAEIKSEQAVLQPFLIDTENLNGTMWEVELVSVSPEGVETPIRDKIKFVGKSFESYYFSSRGFSRSNYSVTVHENGVVTWETMQRNEKGEMISWRGDWQGNKMEGVLSYHSVESGPHDFSFMSSRFGVQK
ncbi:MAG: transposase [Candidatus Omnitrophica bacterium]|nr:transposase [Candidatus Omnitrophota bacterium]